MKLTRTRENDGTVVTEMQGIASLPETLDSIAELSRWAKKQDSLFEISVQHIDSLFQIQPGDGPAIVSSLQQMMHKFRKGAVIAFVCPNPLHFAQIRQIQSYLEIAPPYQVEVFLDEHNARQWISRIRHEATP